MTPRTPVKGQGKGLEEREGGTEREKWREEIGEGEGGVREWGLPTHYFRLKSCTYSTHCYVKDSKLLYTDRAFVGGLCLCTIVVVASVTLYCYHHQMRCSDMFSCICLYVLRIHTDLESQAINLVRKFLLMFREGSSSSSSFNSLKHENNALKQKCSE